MQSIIQPKKPTGNGWQYLGPAPSECTQGYEGHMYFFSERHIVVISAVEVVKTVEKGPEYHISVSKTGQQRCTRDEARFVRKAFGMLDAEEDNHVPFGFVRNFGMPVAERLVGQECPCVDEEPAIVEDKGDFVWRSAGSD